MKKCFLFLVFLPVVMFSQSGPGGVGNSSNNGLWLKADNLQLADGAAVISWDDVSGNSNNAAQVNVTLQPTFVSASMNGKPVVRLDGANDRLLIPDDAILDDSRGLTYYAVIRPNNLSGVPRGILGKRTTFGTNLNYAYTWFFWTGNRLYNDLNTANNRYNTTDTYANATNYILSFDFNGDLPSAERSRLYEDGLVSVISGESSTDVINSNEPVVLGALNDNYSSYLGADYAEVIHYNFSLDSLQHVIVSNYLSAKYNINISSVDLYDMDEPANGNYENDVAGIGQITPAMRHDDAQGCSILRINNPSDLGDNEYLFWGHNGDAQVATNTTDVPVTVEARFEREWRVSEVDGSESPVDVGGLDMSWDLSNLGPVTASDLVLLVDSDNDGSFADETPISGASSVGGGIYSFSNVTAIEDNLRFTLGTINQMQTALPVDYSYVALDRKEGMNTLTWVTTSEINNDFFTVQRSMDMRNWVDVATISSKTSDNETKYSHKDLIHSRNVWYYRIKQTDINGNYSFTEVLTAKALVQERLVYPNPAGSVIHVSAEKHDFTVYNNLGEVVLEVDVNGDSDYILNIDKLHEGLYFILFDDETSTTFVKK